MFERKIGGSNIAGICGVSEWSTPLEEYMKITGQLSVPDNPAMYWGRALEPVIRTAYEERTGLTVEYNTHPDKFGLEFVHPSLPYMVGSLDGITHDRVVEIKTARQKWDSIPEQYICQVQYYMMLANKDKADIAVLFGASDFEIYNVDRDNNLIDILFKIANHFWLNHLYKDVPPDPSTPADRSLRWPRSIANAVDVPESEALPIIEKLKSIKMGLAAMEKEKDELESKLKDMMQDSDTLTIGGKPAATWKTAKDSQVFDKDRLQKEQPNLYREYLITRPGSRRFLLK